MSLSKHRRDWNHLGRVDPLWAIFTRRDKRLGRWDLDEFFLTGAQDVGQVMEVSTALGYPRRRDKALDFGCGVGRLTRALASHFGHCCGLDISDSMITRAQELNRSVQNCSFVLNDRDDLQLFADDSFDMIYTKWVLQHLPNADHIISYIRELVRLLRPDGLLVFQVRTWLTLRVRVLQRRRLFNLLKMLGVGEDFLYRRLALDPIQMTAVPESAVERILDMMGAKVLRAESYSVSSGRGKIYFVTKPSGGSGCIP